MNALVACRFCGKNLEQFFSHAPLFCPYCGGTIHSDTMKHKLSRDSNPLTGRALWSSKISFLGVVLGMVFLIGAGTLLGIAILVVAIAADPASFSTMDALMELIETMLLSPVGFALLAIVELVLFLPPLILIRKYRKPVRERLQLLGWRPYFGESSSKGGLKGFGKDVGISLVIAASLVGFQFVLLMLNDLAWSTMAPDTGFPGIGAGIMPTNLVELALLVLAMLFCVGPAEEFLFRGFAQQGFEANIGERNALLLTALLFTFVHVIPGVMPMDTTLYMFLPYFGLSLVICGYYTVTKDLNKLVLVHGLYNSMLVVYAFFMGNEGTIQVGITFIIACLGFFAVMGTLTVIKFMKHKVVAKSVQKALE